MLDKLVTDWGGFEKFIASLHESGDVRVEHNVVMPGRSGAPRQIDVLVRQKQGFYEHLVVIECKWWATPVDRLHVDALATTIREVGASRGVIFSRKGFQSGAIEQARHEYIDLFLVRDLTDEEWGSPGRVVDLFLQCVQTSVGNVQADAVAMTAPGSRVPPLQLNIAFDENGPVTATRLCNQDGSIADATLEMKMAEAISHALKQTLPKIGVFNSGATGVSYTCCRVNMCPERPFVLAERALPIFIRTISFDLGIKFDQSRITIDRADYLLFAVAVESFITRTVAAASRKGDESYTRITDLQPIRPKSEDVLVNGTLIRVVLKGMFPFDEIKNLEPVPLEDVVKPFIYEPPLPT